MTLARSVVINGDLGSGKTTVSMLLAERLGVRRISIGDLYRDLAAQRGLSALQLNRHAELDDEIDAYVDRVQRDIVRSGERLIVDSRLAWHFFTDARKVHLITEPGEAARRVLGRPTDVENYATLEEARRELAARSDSERVRFLSRYGVDKADPRNYDLVVDTSRVTPAEIVDTITGWLAEPPATTVCFLDPRRIVPLGDGSGPLVVGYAAPDFVAVRGGGRLGTAIRAGENLVRALLAATSAAVPD
jgi:predicted cytidylate kinase